MALSSLCVLLSGINSQYRDELGPSQEAPQVSGSRLAEDSGLRGTLQNLPQVIQEGLGEPLGHRVQ